MTLGHIEIPVSDTKRSFSFYVDLLGFELVEEQGPLVWVRSGPLEVLLRPGGGAGEICLVLYSANPADEAGRLTRGGVAVQKQGNCYFFRDPDGHEFQLVNPSDDHSDSSSS